MRVAIISDIHSNLEALTKALDIIKTLSVDEIICLGDIIGYGANPNECLELVRKNCSVVVIGNHDEAVLNLDLLDYFTEDASTAIFWTHKQITKENYEYLKTLQLLNKRDNLLFVHSSPCIPREWKYIFVEETAINAFNCFTESFCFIGHTHIPAVFSTNGRTRVIKKEDRFIINVGSIGQPRDRNINLSFGLFDTDKWHYENIRNPYDYKLAAEKIFEAGLPIRLGQRLLIGV